MFIRYGALKITVLESGREGGNEIALSTTTLIWDTNFLVPVPYQCQVSSRPVN